MKDKKYDYYRMVLRKAEQLLEFESLNEFLLFIQTGHIKQIIKTTDTGTGTPCFAITHKGGLYICPTAGYESLEDFQSATENKFPDAATFYAAREKNCHTFAEYQMVQGSGITDAGLFSEMKKAGYADGFSLFESLRGQKAFLPRLEQITNLKEFYEFAKANDFKDFQHFLKVWEAGFTNPLEFNIASEKGLGNAEDYQAFQKGGFNFPDEYKGAKPLDIKTREEWLRYSDLLAAEYPGSSFDQLLMLSIVSKLPNGDKTTFKKLYDHYLKREETYKVENENGEKKLPRWFSKRLLREEDFKKFLTTNEFVKRYGTYDAEKEIFETIHIKLRSVVVDGSNVAYNSDMVRRKALAYGAEFKNILQLVQSLKNVYGFTDVRVISDAPLIHKAKDKELLKEIKALCRYSDVPAGTSADEYLIKEVKKHHCLLITNDNFSDWKLTDKWVEDNIDYYKLRFVVNGETVMVPYMDKFK